VCTLRFQSGTQAVLSTSGGFPSIYYSWRSTQQNGIESGCRGGITQLASNAGMNLIQQSGSAYSDGDSLTSWSVFGITNLMTYNGSLTYAVSNVQSFNQVFNPVNVAILLFVRRKPERLIRLN